MTQIEPWQGDVAAIDQTAFYNDWLITPRDLPQGGNEAFPVDGIQSSDVTGGTNPSAGLVDAAITSARFLQPGDRLFRLPNGGIIMRRSILMDRCMDQDLNRHRLNMSEAATQAIAYFHTGSRRIADLDYCQAEPGNVAVPFNLSSADSVRDLRRILGEIREARGGTVSNSTLDADFAWTLANAVDAEELNRLESAIDTRITANMNPIERLMYRLHQQPWYVYVPADLLGTAAATAGIAAIFHYVSKWLQGPPPPPPGGPGIPELLEEVRGLREQLRGPQQAPAPETATAERSALEMNATAYWIGAVGAATLLAGIFHFRGRAREAEVRNGEVRVREAAEVRVRDLAAQAPVARPRVEAREATTGGVGDFFRMMREQPALAR